MPKSQLRAHMAALRRRHTVVELSHLSEQIVESLAHSLPDRAQAIVLYYPLPDEVDVRPLMERLLSQQRTVLLPCVTGPTTMELRRYTGPDSLSAGAYGIMEPKGPAFDRLSAIDVAVVPGVAFDIHGHRLGRGRGYYDRFLADVPYIYKIGVCFPFQLVGQVPVVPTDIAMDTVVAG